MSKLSMSVQKIAKTAALSPAKVDALLAQVGTDVQGIRTLEELAEAGKRYAQNHEDRVAATAAKFKIARHGGRVLIDMAEAGERATQRSNRGNQHSSATELSTLDNLGITKQRSHRWQRVARMPADEFDELIAEILKSDPDDDLPGMAHVGQNSGENEWYTPQVFIDAARAVMGGIDLNPASNKTANSVVGATTFYTAEDDGLSQPWRGRVWMNPPYAQPLYWEFCEKLSEEVAQGNVEQACALVNNNTETVAFQRMCEVAAAICFPARRVKFWHPERESAAPLQGQAVLYFGPHVEAFAEAFKAFGFTVAVLG